MKALIPVRLTFLGFLFIFLEKNKNVHVLSLTETKSQHDQRNLSGKVNAALPEALQGRDSHCLRGQRQMTKKCSMR